MDLINRMKRTRRVLVAPLLVALALATAGCGELLQENPASTVSPVNFYRNGNDALAALMGVYGSFRYVGNNISWSYLIENSTPQSVNRRDRNNSGGCWDVFACPPSNDPLTELWNDSYEGINRANAVIDNVPTIEDMDAGQRARIVAEARFLRALHYFTLVQFFGGVPLFEHETTGLTDLAKPRASADEIYEFIIADLTAAKEALPAEVPASEFGRATLGAAHTLLGKVYLQRGVIGQSNPFGDPLYWPTAQAGDLDAAITEFRAVMALGYELVPDYNMLWQEATENNSEVIFSIRYSSFPDQGQQICTYTAPLFSNYCYRQFAAWWGAVPFWESYAPGDLRKEATWIAEFVDADGIRHVMNPDDVLGDNFGREGPAPRKYIGTVTGLTAIRTSPTDFVMLRYADVLLSLAEALWRQNPASGEALQLVNQVRERAGMEPLTTLTEEALYWERNWELATEQKARFDALRFWDLYIEHMVANAMLRQTNPEKYDQGQPVPPSLPEIEEPKIRLIPIPQNALDLNPNLVQNPGY